MARTNRWIGNLALVVEGELFGQAPLNEYHGQAAADRIEQQSGALLMFCCRCRSGQAG